MLRRNELVSVISTILFDSHLSPEPDFVGTHYYETVATHIVETILKLQQGKVWENNDD